MLEEFDGEYAVEGSLEGSGGGEVVSGDVASDDVEVGEVLLAGEGVDVLFLGARVGEGGYVGVGVDFGQVEGEGTPSAANFKSISRSEVIGEGEGHAPQVKHSHPILQPSSLDVQFQHRHLRLRQRLASLGIQATTILHPRA